MNIKRKQRILFLGGSSLLSFLLCNSLLNEYEIFLVNNKKSTKYLNFPVIKVNLNSPDIFAKLLENYSIDIVFNLIGLTNVEECQADPEKAFFLNSVLPEKITKGCFLSGKKLVHISTDHFFADEDKLHSEEDKVSLLNIYAKSKYQGEINVLANSPSALICRTNFFGFGPPHKKSFSDWIIDSSNSNKLITLHNDVFFTPLSGKNLGKLILKLINLNCYGIYNVSSDKKISKYHFALKLCDLYKITKNNILAGSIKNTKDLVLRPTSMGLSNFKITNILKESIGGFEDQILSIL